MADSTAWRPASASIPTQPGVYRFSDPQGRVIYVGKAKNLRSRLNSYFADPAGLHFRTQTMVATAAKVEWTVVQNELESLQLEYTWIKEFDPRFNVRFRDDKSYPWVAVSWSEDFPRVWVGRGERRKGNRYFGPYAHVWAIRDTIDTVLQVFPMRSCSSGVFRDAERSGKPCLFGHIGKCSAPCVGRISALEHRELVDNVCLFLAGHSRQLTRRLQAAMKEASDNLEFERAARVRDQLNALTFATEKNAIVLLDGTDADLIALADDPLEVAVQIFHVRDGRVRGERSWVAERMADSSAGELVETFLVQFYGESGESGIDVPKLILVPELPANRDHLAALLAGLRGGKVTIKVPQRGDKAVLLDTVARNANESLARHKRSRASDLATRQRALAEIQEALELPEAPLRMECFDVSHLQGTDIVASMVVFEDGIPRRSDYRRFVIRGQDGSDDVAAIGEVISRRFRHYLDDQRHSGGGDVPDLVDPTTGQVRRFAYAPSLVVVDGGAPQVAAAQRVLTDLGITGIGLCGLAKRLEEVWLPGQEYPVILPRSSEGLFMLQRLRDESHRFAITHHRSRRSKSMLDSLLDEVPGLGKVRKKAVLERFGSVSRLRQASVADIATVPGIGPKTAGVLYAALRNREPGEAVNMTTGEVTSP